MRIRNNLRFADKGKVLINLEDFTYFTIFALDTPYKEVNEKDVEWEILKLKYDLKED